MRLQASGFVILFLMSLIDITATRDPAYIITFDFKSMFVIDETDNLVECVNKREVLINGSMYDSCHLVVEVKISETIQDGKGCGHNSVYFQTRPLSNWILGVPEIFPRFMNTYTANPFNFFSYSNHWPKRLVSIVKVKDSGGSDRELVEFVSKLNLEKPDGIRKTFTLTSSSSWLTVESTPLPSSSCVKYRTCSASFDCDKNNKQICAENYYGEKCNVHCIATDDDNANYTCDFNGHRRCAKHWYGIKCDKECVPSQNPVSSYDCTKDGEKICDKEFTLVKLAGNKMECENPCKHQKLCTGRNMFCRNKFKGDLSCACEIGWKGDKCKTPYCDKYVCVNGGVCSVVKNRYKCLCFNGYSGSRCQDECHRNSSNPYSCVNLGKCYTKSGKFQCICLEGYYGRFCEKLRLPEESKGRHITFVFFLSVGLAFLYLIYEGLAVMILAPDVARKC